MAPHQQRVVDELTELNTKLTALKNFFGSALFANLSGVEQDRMHRQAVAMSAYSDVLAERIAAFE